MDNKLQELLDATANATSSDLLWKKLVDYAFDQGIRQLHTWYGMTTNELTFVSTTPDWWHEFYVEKNVIEYDHIAHHAIEGYGPLVYGYDKDKHDPHIDDKCKELVKMTSSEFKYSSGITMPTFDNYERIGGINLCFSNTVRDLTDVSVEEGQRFMRILLATCSAHEKMHSMSGPPVAIKLTPRQEECLKWLATGLNPQQIADRLGLSYHTVKMHLDSAKERLGAENRIHAVAKAIAAKIISID